MTKQHDTRRTHRYAVAAATLALLGGTACGDAASQTGSLTVLIDAEEVLVEGLQAGDDVENIADGWSIQLDKYIAVVGDIDLHLATDEGVDAEAEDAFIVDLTTVPSNGLPLWELDSLQAGRWEFSYSTPGAGRGAERHSSVSEDDADEMESNDWTYLIDGVMTKQDGVSCPPASLASPPDSAEESDETSGGNTCYVAPSIRFTFGAAAETLFGPCEIDGVPGVSIPEGGSRTVAATIHGDHLFFNGFPEGSEGVVKRLAQWLADCDLDLDGTVTQAELETIDPADLPEIDDRFQLGGSPLTPLDTMYTYVRAQLKTQGHFQGEGECLVDGETHDHE